MKMKYGHAQPEPEAGRGEPRADMKYGHAFPSIESLADSVLNAEYFYKLGPFSERHGCWEITYHGGPGAHPGPAGGIEQLVDRYVTVSVLRMSPLTEPAACCEIEVWAGAEEGIRFTRRRISQFQTSDEEFGSEAFRAMTKEGLQRATKVALELRPSDLTETYLSPRAAPLG